MKQDARAAALQALLQVEESEGYSNIVIDKTIRQMALPPREAALASALFYGVLEKRIAIDWALNRFFFFQKAGGKSWTPLSGNCCGWPCINCCTWIKFPIPPLSMKR